MKTGEVIQRLWRKLEIVLPDPVSGWRHLVWRARGGRIGKRTRLPRLLVSWPHQVRIGSHCILQPDIFFNYDHYWTPGPSILVGDRVFIGRGVEFNCREQIGIGDDCLIASGCKFIDHDHGTAPGTPINKQENRSSPIVVEPGAWLGMNVVVLRGVRIGRAAVIGAGSVVTKSVPPAEVWAGVPAAPIPSRGGG